MQERHTDRDRYFREQAKTTKEYVIPYISEVLSITADSHVLEVGCGEGGNLLPFVEMGCTCRGVDISSKKIEIGNAKYAEVAPEGNIHLLAEDIYSVSPDTLGTFDLIFLRDVIEHLPDQEAFIRDCKQFLKPGGKIFFGFPPWYMPFGGHQQVLKNKWLSKLPYFHILPKPIYRFILKMGGESDIKIKNVLEIKDTGITIERFNAYVAKHDYNVDKRTYWFINPNYKTKFGLNPRKKIPILGDIPFLRNFVTTCYYCIISPR